MHGGINHGHAFGYGGGVEGPLVSRNQGNRAEVARLIDAIDFECGGQLHGIVGSQSRCACQEPSHRPEVQGSSLGLNSVA